MVGSMEPRRGGVARGKRQRQVHWPLLGDRHVEFSRSSLKVAVSAVTIISHEPRSFQEIKPVHPHRGEPAGALAKLSEVRDGIYLYIKGLKERITYLEEENSATS